MTTFYIVQSAEIFSQAMGLDMDRFFSFEAGVSEGVCHFDHHRPEHRANSAPCADERILCVTGRVESWIEDILIAITHLDADTYVGILRLLGLDLPRVDFSLMERIDLNGSSVVDDLFNPTLLYMVGIGEVARKLKFPRPDAAGPIDVTALVEQLLDHSADDFIAAGRSATVRSEDAYLHCLAGSCRSNSVPAGLWIIDRDDPLDPSRPYRDGTEVVVVFRRHYESVSIYCSPNSKWSFGGKELAGIQFAGHPKAAGSPRGVAFAEADAHRVFAAICDAQ